MQTMVKDPDTWVKVSERGQMCLPAEMRRRWGLVDGGHLKVVDMGSHAVLVPDQVLDEVRAAFARALETGEYDRWVAEIDDPDLRTEGVPYVVA